MPTTIACKHLASLNQPEPCALLLAAQPMQQDSLRDFPWHFQHDRRVFKRSD